MLACVANWFLKKRADDQHGFHVEFVLEVATVKATFAKRNEKQQLAFKFC